jgi:hypothetical protein
MIVMWHNQANYLISELTLLTLSPIQVTSRKSFKTQNYMAMTSSWVVYRAEEGGFDPEQSHSKKERHHGVVALKN